MKKEKSTTLFDLLRHTVSGERRRYNDGEFDLDLSYVTGYLIAMSYPAEGISSAYRNNIHDVSRMLNSRLGDNYYVYNLAMKPYDHHYFSGRVNDACGWPDHHSPPLHLLLRLLVDIQQWLNKDRSHAAVIHCLAGKGRTGTVISSMLLYNGLYDDARSALRHFGHTRSKVEAGVRQPSQIRYVKYISKIIRRKVEVRRSKRLLRRIHWNQVPNIGGGGVKLLLHIYRVSDENRERQKRLIYSNAWLGNKSMVFYGAGKQGFDIDVHTELEGDILIEAYHVASKYLISTENVLLFRCAFHTCFVSASPLTFTKAEVDVGFKDPRIPGNFEIALDFDMGQAVDEKDPDYPPEELDVFFSLCTPYSDSNPSPQILASMQALDAETNFEDEIYSDMCSMEQVLDRIDLDLRDL